MFLLQSFPDLSNERIKFNVSIDGDCSTGLVSVLVDFGLWVAGKPYWYRTLSMVRNKRQF